jgi:hypothetical protein
MKAGEVLTPQVDHSMDAPKCEKCGDEIMGGASIWCCRYARECPMWPHSDGTAESDAAELLMAKLWMGNALEQIGCRSRIGSASRPSWRRHRSASPMYLAGFPSPSITGFEWPGSKIQWEVTHWMPLPEAPK